MLRSCPILPYVAGSLLPLLLCGCTRPPAPPPPAVEKPKTEQELARTTLSPRAVRSLGVRSEKIHLQPVQEQARLTGWIMARQGHEVTVTAPVAGYVRAPTDSKLFPVAGLPVERGQELFVMEPVLSPLEEIQLAALKRTVESEVAKARESVTVAEKEWQRVKGLFDQKLRGEQDLEQAQARLQHAREDLAAAEDKRKLFADAGNGGLAATFKPISLRAPRSGTVLMVPVSPGQYVPAAAPLVTLADLTEPWVRVPISEHDLPRVDRKQPALLVVRSSTGGKDPEPSIRMKPVAVVPLVDTARHTADLVYELPKAAVERGPFARDQMVTVLVPLNGGKLENELVVPYEAVVFDAYGSAWIYFELTPAGATQHLYERRRVELGPNVTLPERAYEGTRDGVVVRLSERSSEKVVTAGASALFSREFHKPPVAADAASTVDDDD